MAAPVQQIHWKWNKTVLVKSAHNLDIYDQSWLKRLQAVSNLKVVAMQGG